MSRPNPSGAIHPTVFLVLWFGVGVGLQKFWPLRIAEGSPAEWVGVALIATGAILFGWTQWVFWRAGTTVDHGKPTTALVTHGPFRVSRHPLYLGMTCILLGLGLESGLVWLIALTPLFALAVQRLTIVAEEAYLERTFGEAYRSYRSSVRRWI